MSTSERLALPGGSEVAEITAPPDLVPVLSPDGRPRKRIALPPSNPQGLCLKCGGENIDFTYHAKGIQYQGWPVFPCYYYTANAFTLGIEPIGEHICKRCVTCGFQWMEDVSVAGPDYQVVAVEDDDLYDDGDHEGADMSIRKTGSATGEVLGVDEDTALVKEASAGSPWGDQDEKALDDENTAADQED